MEEFSMPQSILQIVSEKGFDGLREIMQMLFNEAMKMERENYLHASPYQRAVLRSLPCRSAVRQKCWMPSSKKWREQPLPEPIKYLLLDARYEKVRREDNTVVDCALLVAYGITESGRRCVLGVNVELSEAKVHWRKFLESLIARGLHGLKLIVSDNHVGLKAARKSVFPFRDSDASFIFSRMPLRIFPGKVCSRRYTTTFVTCSICRHGPMLKSS